MHSPWGRIYQVVKETGWTWHYVLWKVSWANIQMMLADRPSLRKIKNNQMSGAELAARYNSKHRNKH